MNQLIRKLYSASFITAYLSFRNMHTFFFYCHIFEERGQIIARCKYRYSLLFFPRDEIYFYCHPKISIIGENEKTKTIGIQKTPILERILLKTSTGSKYQLRAQGAKKKKKRKILSVSDFRKKLKKKKKKKKKKKRRVGKRNLSFSPKHKISKSGSHSGKKKRKKRSKYCDASFFF